MNDRIRALMSPQPADHPLVIGHRGLAWSYPENTLPSYDAAVAARADMVELDFHPTVDSHLVCVHDTTLARYLDPHLDRDLMYRPVVSYTLDELRRLDVGTWKDKRFAGTTVPALDEVLDKYSRACVLLIERKAGTPEQTLEALQRRDAVEHVVVQSFDWVYLAHLHALAPTLALAALGSGAVEGRIDTLRATGATAAHWNDQLRAADVAAIHAAGLPLWLYTLNSELAWRGALAMQIDGIATDRCDEARAFLA